MNKKIVLFSDTHGKHNQITIPDGDMLIFCGDISIFGRVPDINKFAIFISKLPHQYKIIIPGNHDLLFEQQYGLGKQLFDFKNTYFLCNESLVIDKIKIWGSPISPFFHNWAFNKYDNEIKKYWDMIPEDIDILVTHTPPFNILDKLKTGENVGCTFLRNKVEQIKPKLHCFGHIHHSYGILKDQDITFINSCILNDNYKIKNKPIIYNYI